MNFSQLGERDVKQSKMEEHKANYIQVRVQTGKAQGLDICAHSLTYILHRKNNLGILQ